MRPRSARLLALLGAAPIEPFVTLLPLGLVSPIGTALLHELSASAVILNSARLLRAEPWERRRA